MRGDTAESSVGKSAAEVRYPPRLPIVNKEKRVEDNAERREMITLYREETSPQADAIEAEFRDMALGYDRVVVGRTEAEKLFGAGTALPVITNNERTVSGEAIPAYIRELGKLWEDWQKFQGDYCYVDEDGETC
ncbi:conserved hypothetical protein [Candidatus Denitrolinea symbiosum]|jgi:hypothetical protein|nr:conserved hypothetical protein [Candidatus Denitrolinea symbiosum]